MLKLSRPFRLLPALLLAPIALAAHAEPPATGAPLRLGPPVVAAPATVPSPPAAPALPPRTPPSYEAGDCPFVVPDGEQVTCGHIFVPAGEGLPADTGFTLPFAILHSLTQPVAPDPIVFVDGGPGQATLTAGYDDSDSALAAWWDFSKPLRQGRDVVLMDARGTGLSQPSYDCPELDNLADEIGGPGKAVPPAEIARREDAALAACGTRLKALPTGLQAMTTDAMADDIAVLAERLGASRVDLYAVSYGTRVALEVLRRHPQLVRAAVLDAVEPPQANAEEDAVDLTRRAFGRLFTACARDPACRQSYPRLDRDSMALFDRLRSRPLTVDYVYGPPETITLDRILTGLMQAMYDAGEIPLLPAILNRAAAGETEPLLDYLADPIFARGDIAEGAALAISCREDWASAKAENVTLGLTVAGVFREVRTAAPAAGRCPSWAKAGMLQGLPPLDPDTHAAVYSGVPVLLLSGAFDPVTPPEWADLAKEGLSRASELVFPAGGHIVSFDNPCAHEAVARFFGNPSDPSPPGCFAAEQAPKFMPPEAAGGE